MECVFKSLSQIYIGMPIEDRFGNHIQGKIVGIRPDVDIKNTKVRIIWENPDVTHKNMEIIPLPLIQKAQPQKPASTQETYEDLYI